VQLEMEEIQAQIACSRELAWGQKWYDYRIIYNTHEVRYRMFLVLLVTFFSQFIGGSISYYMPIVYENLGITSSSTQLLLNALSTVVGFVFGLAGSWTVDSFGRRNLFLWGTFLTGLCYLVMNVLASKAHGHISNSMGYAFIVFSFLYGAVFSFTWTPLQALYPTEVLRNDIRVKGMASQGILSGLGTFINQYATPIALNNIGWKTYTIFLIIHFIEWTLMYFFLVETKGRSLEELDEIFTDPKPVKKSLEKRKVIVESGKGVISKEVDC
jgi:MFS family permease